MNRKRRYYLEVTYRPAKELEEMQARIVRLEGQLSGMAMYADMSLALTDQLREAKRRLDALGEDSSFIRLR